MNLSIKKFIYLLNDVTNLLLKKEKTDDKEKIKKLQAFLVLAVVLLAVSLILNIYLFVK